MAVHSRLRLISYSQELVDGQPVYVSSNSLPIKALKFEPAGHAFHTAALKLLGCEEEDADSEDQKASNEKEQAYMPSYDSYSSKGKKKSGIGDKQQDHYALLDEFDDEIPTDCASHDFFRVFGPAFMRNGRCFKSWREFPHADEFDLEQAESREHKRWMERQNAKLSEKARKEEYVRIRTLVDNAYRRDPRILRRKEEEKAEKQRKKEAKFLAKKLQEEEAARAAEEEKRRKEEEERCAAEAALQQKKLKEKEKKLLPELRNICDEMEGKNLLEQAKVLRDAGGSSHDSESNIQDEKKNVQQNGSAVSDGSVPLSSLEKKEKPWGKEEIELLRKGMQKYPKEHLEGGRLFQSTLRKPAQSMHLHLQLERKWKDLQLNKGLKAVRQRWIIQRNLRVYLRITRKPDEGVAENGVSLSSEQDAWSAVQERALVQALKTFPRETSQRWERVAAAVPGKTVNQCKKKFALLKDNFRNKKNAV
ncbi:hypothetical protein GH714_014675 [Hevea brasiliensis]|uniref:Myb-like domain-containing protein n=1 Tax=Hevea brasiliensis TaxID=3981 RepID=A0A6A6M4W2_HEVBR|nr:hypothetical protein GH714_014675 [Hevea brasiliensis]